MMHSPNSSCNNNLEPIPNYTTLFPENDTTSFFPNSPHIHLEYEDAYLQFLHLFYQHQSISNTPDHHNDQTQLANVSKPDHHNQPIIITATSMSKKDRHSKIHTARGPRDRRMRLSLDIARRFFHLQDLLGYDKASRTIEWLLHNAGPAITELAIGRGFSVPTSESSTCDQAHDGHQLAVSSKESKIRRSKKVKRATVERESRRKARERARERTSQKRRLITTVQSTSQDLPLGLISSHTSLKGSMDLSSHYQQQLCTTALPWNPSTLFNFQDEQIAEFEFSGKPWEDFHSFNSFNLSG